MTCSILVLRQIIITESLAALSSSSDLDATISKSIKNLAELLDNAPDAGIKEITETIAAADSFPEPEKYQSRKQLMARMLTKSLENDDPVFVKVNRSIYLATRAVVFAGAGPRGRTLAQGILHKAGAAMLLDRVVRAGEALIVMAKVSLQVHGSWYRFLV